MDPTLPFKRKGPGAINIDWKPMNQSQQLSIHDPVTNNAIQNSCGVGSNCYNFQPILEQLNVISWHCPFPHNVKLHIGLYMDPATQTWNWTDTSKYDYQKHFDLS